MYGALSGMLSAVGEGKVLIGQQLGYGMLQIFRISGMGQLQWRLNLRVFLWLMKKAIYYIPRCLSHKPPFLRNLEALAMRPMANWWVGRSGKVQQSLTAAVASGDSYGFGCEGTINFPGRESQQ